MVSIPPISCRCINFSYRTSPWEWSGGNIHKYIFLWVNTNVILPFLLSVFTSWSWLMNSTPNSSEVVISYCWSNGRVLLLEIDEMMTSLRDMRARYCSGASHIDTGMKSHLWLILAGEGSVLMFAISKPPPSPRFLSANLTTPSQFFLICSEQFDLSSYGWHL